MLQRLKTLACSITIGCQQKSIGAPGSWSLERAYLVPSGKDVVFCWNARCLIGLVFASLLTFNACAQFPADTTYFARKNTLGVFAGYSSNSSHILLGDAEQRKLLQFGVSYSHRLVLNETLNWQFSAEVMPVSLVGDPLTRFVNNQTKPTKKTFEGTIPSPFAISYNYTQDGVNYTGTETITCSGRRWTMGEALSPFGMQLNFMPHRKLQPFVIGHGGYMYSTRPVPDDGAGSFNFAFDCGAGLEYFQAKSKSVRVEYRYHHFSNAGTAGSNPGVDNGVLQVTYSFWP
jgi:hypothetical protein